MFIYTCLLNFLNSKTCTWLIQLYITTFYDLYRDASFIKLQQKQQQNVRCVAKNIYSIAVAETSYSDTLTWSDIAPICEPITEHGPYYRFWPFYQISGGLNGTLQQVRLDNRGRLLLRTPGPVPFGTCICSNVETILSWTCRVYGIFEFRTSLGTSILLLETYNAS